MHQKNPNRFQIFVQVPEISSIPNQTLAISVTDPNQTLRDLQQSLLPPSIPPQSVSFSLNGRILDPSTRILSSSSAIGPFSALNLRFKLLGGGGDGGATGAESRDCYLNMYAVKKPDKADPSEQRLSKFTNCALSFEPLKPPCVIDRLGNVFNKETLVKALLDKNLPKEFGHIKGLKDMIPVHFSLIPGLESSHDAAIGGCEARFQCPISGLELNGNYKFFALRSCGHVFSAKAMKEVKSSACLVCHKEFDEKLGDKIPINGTEEEVALLRERMQLDKANSKKPKKVKNGELSGTKHGIDASGSSTVSEKGVDNGVPAAKKFKAIDVAPAHANKKVTQSEQCW
ncbi:hypothetical protein V2J09_010230 [Rumex salicifolius]